MEMNLNLKISSIVMLVLLITMESYYYATTTCKHAPSLHTEQFMVRDQSCHTLPSPALELQACTRAGASNMTLTAIGYGLLDVTRQYCV